MVDEDENTFPSFFPGKSVLKTDDLEPSDVLIPEIIIKDDRNGLGFTVSGRNGSTKANALTQHLRSERNKASSSGFGVGILNEDDEDIYAPSNYNFLPNLSRVIGQLSDQAERQQTPDERFVSNAKNVSEVFRTLLNDSSNDK